MSRIRIKNFGPIRQGYLGGDGWIEIQKVTVFIGNQGSGKSTVAKLIAVFTWLEKALNRGDIGVNFNLTFDDLNDCLKYHRIENYYREDTILEYIGEAFSIITDPRKNYPPRVERRNGNYTVPKIMYVPAERNLLSTIQNAFEVRGLPGGLFDFAEEMGKAQIALNDSRLKLPLGDMNYRYDRRNKESYLAGKDYELKLTETSSGYQSLVPLVLVTGYLSHTVERENKIIRGHLSPEQSQRRNGEIAEVSLDESLQEEEKQKRIKNIDARYLSKCLINIVEEPEQNLFPASQQQILYNLLLYNNRKRENTLIITTHSPYLVNDLSLAVEAGRLYEKEVDMGPEVQSIVPKVAAIQPGDLVIYEMDESSGAITQLPNYKGLPSDDNKLNLQLGAGNEQFSKLLELEQKQ